MLFTKDLNVDVLAAAPDSVLGEPVVFSASQGKKLTAPHGTEEHRRVAATATLRAPGLADVGARHLL